MAELLDGVVIRRLTHIADSRGALLGMMRSSDPWFERFGEIYFSKIEAGRIKAWRRHRLVTSNLAAPYGVVRLVLYDERADSPTYRELQVLLIGEQNYVLVTVPPGIWTGWQCVGTTAALLANCATEPHTDAEVEREEWDSPRIPYQWSQ